MAEDQIDPRAVLAALGVEDAGEIVPVTGGWDTRMWRVERDGGRYGLRLLREGQEARATREVIAMRAAARAVPVPRIVAEGLWRDRPAMLMTWCSGVTLGEQIQKRPTSTWSIGVLSGQLLARIHAVPAPTDLGQPRWPRALGEEHTRLRAFIERIPNLRDDVLLHRDFHPLNILADGRRPTGVIDWSNVDVGDPRFDIARTIVIMRLSASAPRMPTVLIVALVRLFETAFLHGYQTVAGPLHHMAAFHAWAGVDRARDLANHLARQSGDVRSRDVADARAWAAYWSWQAGVPA